MKMDRNPNQVNHASLWNFRMVAITITIAVAMRVHQTVQIAWRENVFRATETPTIPEPVARIQLPSCQRAVQSSQRSTGEPRFLRNQI